MQRPGHRKRRGRTTLSNHPSGGAVLNWSPLHTRQWADNKCILRFVALFSISNSGLVSLVGLADGQPGPPSVLTPNSGSRKPALSTCSRILDSDDRAKPQAVLGRLSIRRDAESCSTLLSEQSRAVSDLCSCTARTAL